MGLDDLRRIVLRRHSVATTVRWSPVERSSLVAHIHYIISVTNRATNRPVMSVSVSVLATTFCVFLYNFGQSTALICAITSTSNTVTNNTVGSELACGIVFNRICEPNCVLAASHTTLQRHETICSQTINTPQCVWDVSQQLSKVTICCDTDYCNHKMASMFMQSMCGSPPSSATTTRPIGQPGVFTTTTTYAASTTNSTDSASNSTTSTTASMGQAATTAPLLGAPTTSSSERISGVPMILFVGLLVLLGMYTESNIL
uniref:Uncharacterized protein n=1 Tax=Plectus sambesii TaxID=2011161 RepID=A0A914UY76_9BILA